MKNVPLRGFLAAVCGMALILLGCVPGQLACAAPPADSDDARYEAPVEGLQADLAIDSDSSSKRSDAAVGVGRVGSQGAVDSSPLCGTADSAADPANAQAVNEPRVSPPTFEQLLRDFHDGGRTSVQSHVSGGVLSATAKGSGETLLFKAVGNAVEQFDREPLRVAELR